MSGSGNTGVGSVGDMVARMRTVMPAAWFPMTAPGADVSATPVLDGLLSGTGWAWSYCYALTLYVIQQARLATATGGLLDMICSDFFGTLLKRLATETDDAFRDRIRANLLIPRVTRAAVSAAIATLLGQVPEIFEPSRAADTGGYGSSAVPAAGGGGGYAAAGIAFGSSEMPFQYRVTVCAGSSRTTRASQASYIDGTGAMQIAGRYVTRYTVPASGAATPLIEPRGFNLIKDSVGWSGCVAAATGAGAQWALEGAAADAVWAGQPVLQVSIIRGGSITGPAAVVASDGNAVTGSAWVMLPSDPDLLVFSLRISDPDRAGSAVIQPSRLGMAGKWQRITATLPTALPGAGSGKRRVSIMLIGAAIGPVSAPVLTQCWQIEPGTTASSYIPSARQIGIREADSLVAVTPVSSLPVETSSLYEAIGRAAPAGSVAWTAVSG
ncbi:phage head spike fiber domain-containing protein [Lichenicola sp.]|uniref:phage head spike fiber domain-containing protein n=1 Tax=Lichenicola sp. TaxID=2804529 RepID=UPI003B00FA30